jgi:hypothetical protein
LAITEIVVAALEDMNPQPPEPSYDVAAQWWSNKKGQR